MTYKVTRIQHDKHCALCTLNSPVHVPTCWQVEQVGERGIEGQKFHFVELEITATAKLGAESAVYVTGGLVMDGSRNMPVLEKR